MAVNWQDVITTTLTTVGGTSVALTAGTFLLRTSLSYWMTLDVEKFKAKLKSDADSEIERLKHSLQMAALEHQVKFSNLHERRANVIAEVYGRLVEVYEESRTVELNRDATEAAARLLMHAESLKPPANKPEHYLMPKHLSRIAHGKHKGERGYDPNQHQQYWDTAWHSLTEKAGFPGLRFHDLRHTFITHMVELGVSIGVIQTFVGHMSARMVGHYTHVSSGAARKAVELLDSDPILVPAAGQEVHYA